MNKSVLSIDEHIVNTTKFPCFPFRLNKTKLKKYIYTEYDFEIKKRWGKDFYTLPQREQKSLFESVEWQKDLPNDFKNTIAEIIINQLVDIVLVENAITIGSNFTKSSIEFKVPTSCKWNDGESGPRLYYNIYTFDKPTTGKTTFTEEPGSVYVSPVFHCDCCLDYNTFKKVIRRYTDASSKCAKDLLNSPYLE